MQSAAATTPANNVIAFIVARCSERFYTTGDLYHTAIAAGLSTVKPEGGMTITHREIESACYDAERCGTLRVVYGRLDMFRAA